MNNDKPAVLALKILVERIGSQPDTHCWDDDDAAECWSYSPQLVADLLDAERKRHREELAYAKAALADAMSSAKATTCYL